MNNKIKKLIDDDIGRWVTYTNGDTGKIKEFDNEAEIAWVIYKCNGNWDMDQWKEYTAEATQYDDLFFKQ